LPNFSPLDLGEFDRVSGQVKQDLCQATLVTAPDGQLVGNNRGQSEASRPNADRGQSEHRVVAKQVSYE
jgi:hypothetical protein